MTPTNWRDEVKAYIAEAAKPVDKYGHQPRLYALVCEIAQDPAVLGACDDDVLFAAAWMHDLGVFVGHRPEDPGALAGWNHVPYTLARTRELLTVWGFPAEKLEKVAEAIATHQSGDSPRIPEAVVLRDADMLEQLGAVGLLRAVCKVGRDSRFARFSDVVPVLERALQELPAKIRLERAREMAVARIEALRAVLAALHSEAGELIC